MATMPEALRNHEIWLEKAGALSMMDAVYGQIAENAEYGRKFRAETLRRREIWRSFTAKKRDAAELAVNSG